MPITVIKDVTPKKDELRIRRLVIEVPIHETIVAINEQGFYELGEPMDEVLHGHILAQAHRVVWDSIEQKWIRA